MDPWQRTKAATPHIVYFMELHPRFLPVVPIEHARSAVCGRPRQPVLTWVADRRSGRCVGRRNHLRRFGRPVEEALDVAAMSVRCAVSASVLATAVFSRAASFDNF